jgi:Divergent InlB B-repeat domain
MKCLQAYSAYVFRVSLFFSVISVLSLEIACAAQLTLLWTDNATNEDGFRVERKLGTTGTFAPVATVGTNVTSYVDASLSASTTYCYRVHAFNSAGNSAPSNESCGTTAGPQQFRLSISLVGSGTLTSSPSGINCPGDCIEDYVSGTQVTLSPSPLSGWRFSNWGGECTGQGSSCVLTMSGTKNVTVSFAQTGGGGSAGTWTVLPIAGATASGPTLAMYEGNLSLLVRGFGDGVYFTRRIAGVWSPWLGLNGFTFSEPGAVEFNGALWVFIRGTDNGIYLNRLTASGWTGWSGVPGGGATLSGPRAVVFNNQLHLFVRGTSQRIYLNRLTGSGWTGWSEVPGATTLDAPTATVFQGTLDVVIRDVNNRISHNTLSASGWSGWGEVPGNGFTPAAPAAAVFNGELWYFVQGFNDLIYQTRFAAGAWNGWNLVPGNGATLSGPGATSTTTNMYLAVRGTNSGVYLLQ